MAWLFLIVGGVYAQTDISGTVVSEEDNEPIIGASVVVEGTKLGTVTDAQGRFTLQVPKGKSLVFTYIGMQKQTVQARPGMRVVLVPDNKTLGEVVVTGVQQMDKRTFTGAATKIDADKAKLDGIADISRSLEGRVAGVSVQNVSGTFGTAPKIRVRGATSIYAPSRCGSSMVSSWRMSRKWMPTSSPPVMPRPLSPPPSPVSTPTISRVSRF